MSDHREWHCPVELSKIEKFICSKLKTTGKLFVFLRKNRHLIFNDEISQKLIAMYKAHPKGKPPVPAAQLAMATLLQAYEQKSDAGAIQEAMFDKRWQMVLNCLGEEVVPFSQGTLCDFRHRLVEHNMDITLLEHTVDIAKKMGGFSDKALRVALDSAPLQGSGRVEDTFNLVSHALELVVSCAASIKQVSESTILSDAGTQLMGHSSIKAALDIDWSDTQEKANAINILMADVTALKIWLSKQSAYITEHKALKESLNLLETVLNQNIEPDPGGGSKVKQGVAPNRMISLSDKEMRHGRKSSSRTINGYKQHIAIEMSHKLVLATSVRPANEPEHMASEKLKPKVEHYGSVTELSIDRGYLSAPWTIELFKRGETIKAKPWRAPDNGFYNKKDFTIDLIKGQVTCPQGHTVPILTATERRAKFKANTCNSCPEQAKCTRSKQGRIVTLNRNEELMQSLSYYVETSEGRAQARERVKVEHTLASICNRKGPRARYKGIRLNEYDLNRTAMVTNLHVSMNIAA